ncbi:hypothetical protein [Eggerthella sp. YY7918]|uniref:hypothetical protein n=1 Tax=Eggerthella sp. (strain YY7918) TaxID=502558 RepID=UPI00021710CA|nr:hypothetical protein [Eggerthella sp. YY7918]BAK43503.1 hypothetical protein EGYY_02670 [Eggerthella sp. YY7918]
MSSYFNNDYWIKLIDEIEVLTLKAAAENTGNRSQVCQEVNIFSMCMRALRKKAFVDKKKLVRCCYGWQSELEFSNIIGKYCWQICQGSEINEFATLPDLLPLQTKWGTISLQKIAISSNDFDDLIMKSLQKRGYSYPDRGSLLINRDVLSHFKSIKTILQKENEGYRYCLGFVIHLDNAFIEKCTEDLYSFKQHLLKNRADFLKEILTSWVGTNQGMQRGGLESIVHVYKDKLSFGGDNEISFKNYRLMDLNITQSLGLIAAIFEIYPDFYNTKVTPELLTYEDLHKDYFVWCFKEKEKPWTPRPPFESW